MYSREEKSAINKEFWTAFGLYMKPMLSAEGFRVNWINYKTGVQGIQVKMYADHTKAYFFIELKTKDAGLKDLLFEQFLEFKSLFETTVEGEWTWVDLAYNEFNQEMALVKSEEIAINIYNKMDWDEPFYFFKQKLISFDAFWEDAKDVFKDLVK